MMCDLYHILIFIYLYSIIIIKWRHNMGYKLDKSEFQNVLDNLKKNLLYMPLKYLRAAEHFRIQI